MNSHEGHQHPILVNSIQDKYWLYSWIDDQGIQSVKDFKKSIRRHGAMDILGEYSASTTVSNKILPRAVIAGRKIDFSGKLGCSHSECLIAQVQSLFGKTLHYFDTLVVDGPLIEDLQRSDSFIDALEHRVKLLLYLR